jgi:hypothetical protein
MYRQYWTICLSYPVRLPAPGLLVADQLWDGSTFAAQAYIRIVANLCCPTRTNYLTSLMEGVSWIWVSSGKRMVRIPAAVIPSYPQRPAECAPADIVLPRAFVFSCCTTSRCRTIDCQQPDASKALPWRLDCRSVPRDADSGLIP